MITYLIPKYPKWKLIIKIVRVTAFVHLLYEDVKCLVLGILIVEVSNEIQFSYPKVDHWSGLFYLYSGLHRRSSSVPCWCWRSSQWPIVQNFNQKLLGLFLSDKSVNPDSICLSWSNDTTPYSPIKTLIFIFGGKISSYFLD